MAYNPNAPADDQFLADFPAEQREQQRAILEDQIVDADKLRGLTPGNANGNVPISNGTKNVNLNADLLDGKEAVEFADASHTHSVATTDDNGFMSNTDKAKLDGISAGAEVNQNAFANVKVGSTTIQADAKQDTLELTAGTNITLTPDATNDKVTIGAPDVLPLSGGTLTGNLGISKGGPVINFNNSNVTRNSAPSADQNSFIAFRDNNGTNLGLLQNVYKTTKENFTRIIAYKGTSTDSTFSSISVGYDSSGNWFTYAPTPSSNSDNSTKIATTAWVNNYMNNVWSSRPTIKDDLLIQDGNYSCLIAPGAESTTLTVTPASSTGTSKVLELDAANDKAKWGGNRIVTNNNLTVQTKTGSAVSVNAGAVYSNATVNVALSGYTPLGVVGWEVTGTNASYAMIFKVSLSGTTVSISGRNMASSAASWTPKVNVLYVKN